MKKYNYKKISFIIGLVLFFVNNSIAQPNTQLQIVPTPYQLKIIGGIQYNDSNLFTLSAVANPFGDSSRILIGKINKSNLDSVSYYKIPTNFAYFYASGLFASATYFQFSKYNNAYYFVGGATADTAPNIPFCYLCKFDLNGTVQFIKYFDTAAYDIFPNSIVFMDSNTIAIGSVNVDHSGAWHTYRYGLTLLDTNGNVKSRKEYYLPVYTVIV